MDYRKKIVLVLSLFVVTCLHAQNINLRTGKTTIREVIETLQKDYGYSFSIRTSEVDVNQNISIDVKEADINSILDKVFPGSKVSYSIDGNLISVTKAAPPKTVSPQNNSLPMISM